MPTSYTIRTKPSTPWDTQLSGGLWGAENLPWRSDYLPWQETDTPISTSYTPRTQP